MRQAVTRRWSRLLACLVASGLIGAACTQSGALATRRASSATTLTMAGATFPAVLYTKWFAEYERLTGVKVNYQAIGSGGGIKSITDQTVDCGATDTPMTDAQLAAAKGGDVLHIPTAVGAVAVTYNLPGIADAVRFTPEALAAIYLGEITRWNEPMLVAENPALARVDRPILVVHRSDGSGTTHVWTNYLSAVSPRWQQQVGVGTAVQWPLGLGAKGNEGVAGEVKHTPYSVGYVELTYALQARLGVGLVRNRAGTFVEPTVESAAAAAAGMADSIAPDLRAALVDAPGEAAYPIATFTWQLVYRDIPNRTRAAALAQLLWWELHDAQQLNAALGYAPLPPGIVERAEGQVRAITSAGQPVFPDEAG